MERRWRERDAVAWKACVWYRDVRIEECTIRDITADGMYIELERDALPQGAQVRVEYCAASSTPAVVCAKGLVVHRGQSGVGLLTRQIKCGGVEPDPMVV